MRAILRVMAKLLCGFGERVGLKESLLFDWLVINRHKSEILVGIAEQ
jgi:hypothetical protein